MKQTNTFSVSYRFSIAEYEGLASTSVDYFAQSPTAGHSNSGPVSKGLDSVIAISDSSRRYSMTIGRVSVFPWRTVPDHKPKMLHLAQCHAKGGN